MTQTKITRFKLQFINEKGQAEGFLRKKGSFDGNILMLDQISIPVTSIIAIEVRDNRMIFAIAAPNNNSQHIAIQVSGVAAKTLKGIINTHRSRSWAITEQQELEAKGLGQHFRATSCPHCSAAITLSFLPETPQVYCTFCDTLTTVKPNANTPKDEKQCKICDECGMFSKPQKFTIFYFYFLLFVYGWRSRPTWRCPGCMRGEAWKMLVGNSIFILGVPVAIVQLIRSYSDSAGGKFAGLDKANLNARKGRTEKALKTYQAISQKVPVSAGVKYNIGLNLLDRKPDLAQDTLEMAYADCSNYPPVFNALCHCYQHTQQFDKLSELRRQWQIEEEPKVERPPAVVVPPLPVV